MGASVAARQEKKKREMKRAMGRSGTMALFTKPGHTDTTCSTGPRRVTASRFIHSMYNTPHTPVQSNATHVNTGQDQ